MRRASLFGIKLRPCELRLKKAAGHLETSDSKKGAFVSLKFGEFFAASRDNYEDLYYVYNTLVDYRFTAFLTINKRNNPRDPPL